MMYFTSNNVLSLAPPYSIAFPMKLTVICNIAKHIQQSDVRYIKSNIGY